MNEISEIYDQLIRYESKNRIGRSYPVHKKLKFSEKNYTLLDWLTSKIKFRENDTILDAGCGTGHSLFYLHKKYGIKGLGVSLSEKEIGYASEIAQKLDLEAYITFRTSSYDHLKDVSFSKILAIESLKHSTDLKNSLNNLYNLLSQRGLLVICDDFIMNDSDLIQEHKKYWKADGLNSPEHYLQIIEKIGHINITIFDLSSTVPKRPLFILNIMYSLVLLLMKIASPKYRRNLTTYAGAILLEKLYVLKMVSYQVIIVEKIN